MKTFENKSTELKINEEKNNDTFDYVELSKVCMNATDGKGMDMKMLQARHRVFEVFDSPAGNKIFPTYQLEDNDYKTLKECVEAHKWPRYHKDIAEFVQYVMDIEKEAPNLKEVKNG